MSNNDQYFESYVPVYDTVPDEWQEARVFLVEQLRKITNSLNVKTIGWLLDEELLSGQNFIPSSGSQQFRSVLRKVVDFGQLPNNTFKAVPHGILFDANFTLIHMWASATSPTLPQALPIPFAAVPSANTPIQMFMDATNIYITTSDDRTMFTRCFVFIEYIQEL